MNRLWLILLVWGISSLVIPRVLAHAELISASPPPGSTVAELTELRLTFSEPIGDDGQIQLHQNFISAAKLEPMVENETELVTSVPSLPDGVYGVLWSVTSADGHTMSGSFNLGIDSSLMPAAPPWYQSIGMLNVLILLAVGGTAVWLWRKQTR